MLMYHATLLKNWNKIRRRGLIPETLPEEVQEESGMQKGVYLEGSQDRAEDWPGMLIGLYLLPDVEFVRKKFVVLEVDVPSGAVLTLDPDVVEIGETPSAYITNRHIPPSNIRLLTIIEAEAG